MTRAMIGFSALAGVLLAGSLTAGPAQAQKIAPSRQYGGPVDPAPNEYVSPNRSSLDKNYGLPSLGNPEANMPRQRTLATPKAPDDVPEFQAPEPAPGPGPNGGANGGANATAVPLGPPDRTDGLPDVFARDGGGDGDPLPSEVNRRAAGSSAMDTPLFTTSQGSDLSTTSISKADPLMTTSRPTVDVNRSTLNEAPAAPGPAANAR